MDALRLMTGTPSASGNYEEIERLLSCPICLEVYSKPVVILPCQHNLCRKCANDVFQQRGTPMGSGGRFRCPTCRYEVVLDRHGVYGLQRNLLVENIIDMYQTEGRKPTFKQVETLMCDDHEEEKVNIYCITCQKPTCSLCKVFGQHQECDVAPMEKVYKDQKREISDAIAMLVSGNDRLQAIITQTEELGKMAESNGRQTKADLCAAFDKLYAVLEERKNNMMSKITADVQERNQVMQEMLKNYGQQLEGASKLMEASLGLLEERSVPQFLSLSRDMIKKVLGTARASEVRKPPFNIQDMDEFKVNFDSQERLLYQLDFKPVNEDTSAGSSQSARDGDESASGETAGKLAHDNINSDSEEEAEVIVDDDVADSDDTATTSVTSRSDSAYSGRRLSTDVTGPSHSHSREHNSGRLSACTSPAGGANETESRRSTTDESPPIIKKGRWYDMYVRQLPTPICMGAPMESSVHMKVIVPDDDVEKEKEYETEEEEKCVSIDNSSSYGSDDRDREVEELLAPRRRRWVSTFTMPSSTEGSFDSSPRSSPLLLRRQRHFREDSPTGRHVRRHHHLRRDSSPSRHGRHQQRRPSDSPPPSFRSESPPAIQPARPTTQLRGESPTSQQSRRPRLYCTHRRRTWSHLLDKK